MNIGRSPITPAWCPPEAPVEVLVALVVDDDEIVRTTIAMQLEGGGWRVVSVDGVAAAQHALEKEEAISVVVCDINLVRESGFDLANALADLRPEAMATEIIFISGEATSDAAIAALRHRAFDLIRKPVRRTELLERVAAARESALRRRRQQAMLVHSERRLLEGETLKQRLVAALRNAEDQNRALEARADQARHDLLAVISHELKTPLIPIVGLADILLNASDLSVEEVQDFAQSIRDGGEKLGAIIDRTLTYLDAERQFDDAEEQDFALHTLIDTALSELPVVMGRPTPRIEIDCPVELRGRGTMLLLAQALAELIDNAIKASPGDAAIGISARRHLDGRLVVEVCDQGPGLPDQVRRNLGVPFLQGDMSLTRRWSGVGIGLARARRIARLNNGDLEHSQSSDCNSTCIRLVLQSNSA